MREEDIQKVLENLGEKVSVLAEENRVFQTRDEAGEKLIGLIGEIIRQEEWLNIYENTEDIFLKEIMLDWGAHLFPKDFVK